MRSGASFEALRVPDPAAAKNRRILTLSSEHAPSLLLRDWFVPRSADCKAKWLLDGQVAEEELFLFLAELHRLGIPTFLREPSPSLMRLFVKVAACTTVEAALPLRDRLVRFLASAVGHAASVMFKHAGNLAVAVFDASGQGFTASRWKLSLRFVCPEITVTADTARKFRQMLAFALSNMLQPTGYEPWDVLLLPPKRRPSGTEQPISFWESIIDDQHYSKGQEILPHRSWWWLTRSHRPLPPPQQPQILQRSKQCHWARTPGF